jgi:DNA processing protein
VSVVLDDDLHDVLAAVSYYVGRPRPAHLRDLLPSHRPAWAQENVFPAWVLRALGSGRRAVELRRFGRSLRRRAEERGIALLTRGDHGWPAHAAIQGLPCLWVRGDVDLAGRLTQAVTVTGARACTEQGRQATAHVVGPLAAAGWTIVTGLSPGIDTAAAAAAFDAERMPPVLVSPAGLEHPAGATLTRLAERARTGGALISPFPPGCQPRAARWAFRDVLLGALTAATVVVEVAATSGAVRTARAARRAGRLVFAVPGPTVTGTWAGCHQLITDGTAQVLTSASPVLAALRVAAGRDIPDPKAAVDVLDATASREAPACRAPHLTRKDGQ